MVITVTCPSCASSFPVDSKKIPAAGVNARCSSCRFVFRIERPVEPPPPSLEPPAPREWVYEQEERRIDPGSMDIRPMEAAEPAPFAPPPFEVAPPATPPQRPVAPPSPPEPEPAPPQQAVGSFTFGKRDPKDKARRLARVLVSDMIMYNPKRHEQALANNTLKQDFEDEIAKSWKEYVEQVGQEMATQNPFWADALNDVLAKGQKIF
ncbi:MAG TPA: zinc-ribbon domain-containing protein [Longimicrobiales bacterium]|nr:zinc-ribbon domain-containing protein [Longimicrobiales bacterium]